ncbi:MAG: LEPR-XLL domain-containing protein, partial [Mariprofundaceae bacterium]|nr:LEPR-XLL domain-containing protein [Mariprofundaceae bacterium]
MASTEKHAVGIKKHAENSNGKLKTADSGPMLALEPRILLDAALADTAAKVADAVVHQGDGTTHAEAKPAGKEMLLALAPMGRDHARREVIFVDAGAKNIKELLGKATPER